MRPTDTIIARNPTGAPIAGRGEILVTIYGQGIGRKVDLDPFRVGGTIIGRDIEADIVAQDDSVSRRHCRLTHNPDGWTIEDLRSTNGTWVAGQQIHRTLLVDGDLIKVGSTIFKFLSNTNVEAAYHEEIYRMAIFDGLTQIHNRRYFEEFTDREITRAQRHGRALSLLLFDVDYFKRINDTYGHLSGDHVLRTLATLIRGRVRRDELFARYAGDEFVIVLPETAAERALEFAETLRVLVANTAFSFDGHTLPVSVSMGVGSLSRDIQVPQDLVAAADAALYRAKEAGRNQARL